MTKEFFLSGLIIIIFLAANKSTGIWWAGYMAFMGNERIEELENYVKGVC
jgi:hypothetical protein